jgi:hypothetical protein
MIVGWAAIIVAVLSRDNGLHGIIQAVVPAPIAAPSSVRVTEFKLMDSSGAPLDGLQVKFDDIPATGVGGGRYGAGIPLDHTVTTVEADGYRPAGVPARRDAGQVITLIPDVLDGVLLDAVDGRPIARANIEIGDLTATTDAEGRFSLSQLPAQPELTVTANGYERTVISAGDQVELTARLKPRELRGGYISFYGVADADIRNNLVKMLNTGELNTVVLDVKGDLGFLSYKSDVPLAEQIGANKLTPFPEMETFVRELKSKGVYTIGRIVVMKDDVLAHNGAKVGLDVAVKDNITGGLWTDLEKLGWVDPFREEVWAYNTALAEEAIRKGFDEVQLDYVRFPTDPGAGTQLNRARFSRVPDGTNRPEAITSFVSRTHEAVKAAGGALSADVFGFVCWREDDMGIGQHLETLAPHLDYISPMVYPSTFNGLPMEPSYSNSPAFPYEVVFYSIQRARERAAGTGVSIRPWLQYFDDYPWATGRRYGPPELAAQVRAMQQLNIPGFLWWDPTNLYKYGPAARAN